MKLKWYTRMTVGEASDDAEGSYCLRYRVKICARDQTAAHRNANAPQHEPQRRPSAPRPSERQSRKRSRSSPSGMPGKPAGGRCGSTPRSAPRLRPGPLADVLLSNLQAVRLGRSAHARPASGRVDPKGEIAAPLRRGKHHAHNLLWRFLACRDKGATRPLPTGTPGLASTKSLRSYPLAERDSLLRQRRCAATSLNDTRPSPTSTRGLA